MLNGQHLWTLLVLIFLTISTLKNIENLFYRILIKTLQFSLPLK